MSNVSKKRKERALQFEREYHHAKKTRYLKSLDTYIKYLPVLLASLEEGAFSKHLFLALTASMEGIIKDGNPLGIFTSDFEKMANLVAKGIIKVAVPHKGEMEERLFSKLIMGGLASLVGLLALQSTSVTSQEQGVEKNLYEELLVRACFSSGIPEKFLGTFARSVGAVESGEILATKILESLAILFLLISIPQGRQEMGVALLEAMRGKLIKNFEAVSIALNDLTLAEKIHRGESEPARFFISQGTLMLTLRNYDHFLRTLNDLVKPYGIQIARLQEDGSAARRLFASLGESLDASSHPKENVILFAG